MNYGFNVKLSQRGAENVILHNITEIHFNFPKTSGKGSGCVVFDSSIHKTNLTVWIRDLIEFEAQTAVKKHK